MSERIITLFGEEIVPEQVKPAGKTKPKKKGEDKKEPAEHTEMFTAAETDATPTREVEPATEQPLAGTENTSTAETQTGITASNVTEEEPPTPPAVEAAPKKTGRAKKIGTPEEPGDGKQYYSIGEVAEMFKVKTSHIRFWTTEFKLKVRTTRKGDRLYNSDQIKELKTIHHLVKERGFTLSGAKTKLKEEKSKDVETVDLKKSLQQLRNKLVAIKNQLK